MVLPPPSRSSMGEEQYPEKAELEKKKETIKMLGLQLQLPASQA